ncbi:hypothetical protein RRG08_013872 [Elysia crispata]|uniref:Uncharacterized protein n=1 Tax=Elysia crispata TaxID=231223 RepID=A0AAE1D0N7_9GAST|nr:hypothetical protein RRG08_013872 [Elysia crispata]
MYMKMVGDFPCNFTTRGKKNPPPLRADRFHLLPNDAFSQSHARSLRLRRAKTCSFCAVATLRGPAHFSRRVSSQHQLPVEGYLLSLCRLHQGFRQIAEIPAAANRIQEITTINTALSNRLAAAAASPNDQLIRNPVKNEPSSRKVVFGSMQRLGAIVLNIRPKSCLKQVSLIVRKIREQIPCGYGGHPIHTTTGAAPDIVMQTTMFSPKSLRNVCRCVVGTDPNAIRFFHPISLFEPYKIP